MIPALTNATTWGVEALKHNHNVVLLNSIFGRGKNLFWADDPYCTDNFYVNETTGALSSSPSYWATGYVPVIAGTYYICNFGTGRFAWYDATLAYISGSTLSLNIAKVAPTGACYLRFSIGHAIVAFANLNTIQIEVVLAASLSTPFESCYFKLLNPNLATALLTTGKNRFNSATSTTGKVINNTGAIVTNTNYSTSDYIKVVAAEVICLSDKTGGYIRTCLFYDSTKAFIAGSYSDNPTSSTVTAPELACYFRFSYVTTYAETIQIESVSKTPYEAFRTFYSSADTKVLLSNIELTNTVFRLMLQSNTISMPAKQYFLDNYENTIYHQAVCERWLPRNYFLKLENGSVVAPILVNRSSFSRMTGSNGTPIVTDVSVDANLYDLDFKVVSTKNFTILAGNHTKTGALTINVIGDSLTYNGTYLDKLAALSTNLTFVGMRICYASGVILAEGRGGWTLGNYCTLTTPNYNNSRSHTPFMHPIDPYKYYGETNFWKYVKTKGSNGDGSGTLGYGFDYFYAQCVRLIINESTGFRASPDTNDVMWDSVAAAYKYWNGSAWTSISAGTLGFTFNYPKYLSTWDIASPDMVIVNLGPNDFNDLTPYTFDVKFVTWKDQMDALIASVHSTLPNAKIVITLPLSVWGSSNDLIDSDVFYQQINAVMWFARKQIIATYDARESELIYVVDFGSGLDPIFGFALTAEKPFLDYATNEVRLEGGNPHPSTAGYNQLGAKLSGFIQYIRS